MFLCKCNSGQKTLPRQAKTVVYFIPVAALFFTTVNLRVDDSGPCVQHSAFLSCICCASLWAPATVGNDLFSPVGNA